MSDTYEKLSEIIGISAEVQSMKFLVNNQWIFTMPPYLEYEVDGEIEESTGARKGNLVLRETDSAYNVPFCAAVYQHAPIIPEYMTAVDCKYDNRFQSGEKSGTRHANYHEIITDTPELYVDVVLVRLFPFGYDMEVRVRGENITPFSIGRVYGVDNSSWEHYCDVFKEIARSIQLAPQPVKKAKKTSSNSNKQVALSDPNCIMDGTVLLKYIGSDKDIVLPEGITELPDMIFSGRSDIHSVIVPEGVTAIGRRAFENCFNLEEVVLPKSLKSLGGYAFVDCHSLKNVYLSSKIKRIENSTFSDCASLENVVIPKSVNYIDGFAFSRCSSFTKIILPEGLTGIGWYAFADCSNLEYIYIPSTVTDIQIHPTGDIAFAGCPKLTIHCLAGTYAEQFAEENDIPYIIESEPPKAPVNRKTSPKTSSTSSQKAAPKAKTSSPKASQAQSLPNDFPNGKLISLSDLEMEGDCLKKVYNLGGDEHIILPEGIKTIGDWAFSNTENLKSVVIPESVNCIGAFAFHNCEHLELLSLPSTLKQIGRCAFTDCIALKTVIIPANVSNMGGHIFDGCTNLESVVLPDSLKEIGSLDYAELASLKSIVIPEGVTHICEQAFIDCKNLESVTLPNTLKKIESQAFADCTALKSIVIPEGITCINLGTFSGCKNLESISLPPTLTQLSDSAFSNCDALRFIYIPDGVNAIGKSAFEGCAGLLDVFVPNSVISIGIDAFCTYNPDLIIHVTPESYAETYCKDNHLTYDYLLPEDYTPRAPRPVTEVSTENEFEIDGDVLIRYTGNAKIIMVPEQVKTIGNQAFTYNKVMEKVILPNGLLTIEKSAFWGCENLRELNLPSGITELPRFARCLKLQSIIIPKRVETISDIFCCSLTDVYIPDTVSEIYQYAFTECEHVTLHVPFGSFAESYAIKNNLSYDNDVDGIWEQTNGQANRKKTVSKGISVRKDKVYLLVMIRFEDNGDFFIGHSFPGPAAIKFEASDQSNYIRDWKAWNRPTSRQSEDEGLADLIISAGTVVLPQEAGDEEETDLFALSGLDDFYLEFINEIYATMGDDKAAAVLIVSLNPEASGAYTQNSCLFNYLDGYYSTQSKNLSKNEATDAIVDYETFLDDVLEAQYEFTKKHEALQHESFQRIRQALKNGEACQKTETERVSAQRKAEYETLLAQIADQARIAEENKGGFLGLGKKARIRKEALQKIAELQEKLKEYPEFQMN